MRRKTRGATEIAAEVLAAVMLGPKTAKQVAERVDTQNTDHIYRYLHQFRKSGVVYIKDFANRKNRPIFALQPALFHFPDAVYEAPTHRIRRERAADGTIREYFCKV